MQNIFDLIREISEKLSNKLDHEISWQILEEITQKTKTDLILENKIDLTIEQKNKLESWIFKYTKQDMPLQYLIGKVEFCNLTIYVEPPTLIPRPETEEWCFDLIKKLEKLKNKNIKILDIGTGSGCLAITLAKNFPEATVVAIDISQQALNLASKNSKFNNIDNLKLIKSNLFENLHNYSFDLIVSNPPYIDEIFYESLDNSVKNWEDKKALTCPEKGLEIIKNLIMQTQNYLTTNQEFKEKQIPQLIIEIDPWQTTQVTNYLKENNFSHITVNKDLAQKNRVISAGR